MVKISSSGRKFGRNKRYCEKYRLENRREKNKVVKLKRHLKKHPKDRQSINKLEELKKYDRV